MKQAAIYIRVSTDEQTEFSPAAQQKALLEYAARNNYDIQSEHIFSDEGYSGKKAEKRPAFMKMISLARLKPPPFDAILVHRFDRFARSREDSVVYKSMLRRENGIKVVSVTEPLDSDDKMSVIIEAVLEAMAEYYSMNLSEEVMKGMTEKARRGGLQTAPPFGYAAEGGRLTIVPAEARHVEFIYQQFVHQNASPSDIADLLNDAGITTRRGNKMDGRRITYILKNPAYCGRLRWTPANGETIVEPGEHSPIIPDALFEAAATKLKNTCQKRSARPATEYRSWLSGLITCGGCGATLIYSKKSRIYQCGGYQHGKCLVSHGIAAHRLENALLGCLDSFFSSSLPPGTSSLYIFNPDAAAHSYTSKRLAAALRRERRAKAAYMSGAFSLEEYMRLKHASESEQLELTASLSAADSAGSVKNAAELLSLSGDTSLRQRVIRRIVDKITYYKACEHSDGECLEIVLIHTALYSNDIRRA